MASPSSPSFHLSNGFKYEVCTIDDRLFKCLLFLISQKLAAIVLNHQYLTNETLQAHRALGANKNIKSQTILDNLSIVSLLNEGHHSCLKVSEHVTVTLISEATSDPYFTNEKLTLLCSASLYGLNKRQYIPPLKTLKDQNFYH